MNKIIKCGAIAAAMLLSMSVSADSYLYWMSDGANNLFSGQWTTARIAYGSGSGDTVTGYLMPDNEQSFKVADAIAGDFYGMQAAIGSEVLGSSYRYALELINDQGILARSSWLGYSSSFIGDGGMAQSEAVFHFYTIPEPTSGLLAVLGFGLLALRRKQKKA